MSRLVAVPVLLVLSAASVARAQDSNPEVNGKRMSAWLTDLQSEPNARLRRVAVASLGELAQLKRMDPAIVRGVATAVGKALKNDSAVSVRSQAVEVLTQVAEVVLEEKNSDPTSLAIDLAESVRVEKEPELRRRVAGLLGRFRKFGKPGVEPLTACLKDSDAGLRQAAADALGRIGDEGRAGDRGTAQAAGRQGEGGPRGGGVRARPGGAGRREQGSAGAGPAGEGGPGRGGPAGGRHHPGPSEGPHHADAEGARRRADGQGGGGATAVGPSRHPPANAAEHGLGPGGHAGGRVEEGGGRRRRREGAVGRPAGRWC